MVCELAQDFAKPNTSLYDIGCSTATMLDPILDPSMTFVGVDNARRLYRPLRAGLGNSLACFF